MCNEKQFNKNMTPMIFSLKALIGRFNKIEIRDFFHQFKLRIYLLFYKLLLKHVSILTINVAS